MTFGTVAARARGVRPTALVVALALATGCHTTVRTRTLPSGQTVEEPGSCDVASVRMTGEQCTEREVRDTTATAVAIVAVVAAVVGAALLVEHVDNNCPIC